MKTTDALLLRRTAKAVKRSAVIMKASAALCVTLVSVVSIVYGISYFYDQYGSFTVGVNKYDMVKQGLSLSDVPEFKKPISRLNGDSLKQMTNISGEDLPANVDKINGSHNGLNYLAYSFYLKNTGADTVTYESTLSITGATKGIDEALWVKVYQNGKPTTYAKTKSDGSGAEKATTEFLSKDMILQNQKREFKSGDVDKYTVVIWLEGDDPDCVDAVIGGRARFDMNFKIVESS